MADNTAPIAVADGEYLVYKGRPLVREGNMICYGCIEEAYTLRMTVMTAKEYNGKEVPPSGRFWQQWRGLFQHLERFPGISEKRGFQAGI